MIDCPNCGTPNRKGSRYCSDCGQRLDTVPIITCPSCNGPNPAGGASCSFCGAPLIPPLAAEKDDIGVRQELPLRKEPVESEPERPRPATLPETELPSWLYQQPAEQPETPSGPAAVSPTPPLESPAEQEVSRYLRGIRGVLPSTDAWPSSSQKRPTQEPTPASEETADIKPESRAGCLPLVLAAVLVIIGLILLLARR